MSRFDPLRHCDPARLTRYMDSFRAGRLRDLALVMDAIEERDDVLASVAPKAKSAVARHGWEILTVNTEDNATAAQAQGQKAALEAFYNNLRVTNALDQDELGGVSLLLRQMMDAKGKRYAVHNIVWQPQDGGRYTATLWFTPLWFFENSTGRMRFIENAYGYDGVPMAPGEWLVTRGQGVMIACAVAWMFKHLPLRDWLLYSQRHGMPGIEGITDAAEGSPEWDTLVAAVQSAASNFKWVRNRNSEIKTIDFTAQGTLPYPPLVERMDRALAALWRGADLSTISAGSGQGQGASLQAHEADLIEEDDAAWLSETLQLKLDRLVLDNTFGEGTPALAYFKVRSANQQSVELDLKIDDFALRCGHPISQQQFAERYQRPLPDSKDALLKLAPQQGSNLPVGAGAFPLRDLPAAAFNERPLGAVGRDAAFRAHAIQLLSRAQQASLAPLVKRVQALSTLDDQAFEAGLAKLKADLPALYNTVLSDPSLAAAFEEILGAAVVSGAGEAAQAQKVSTP
jgi:phage gp29-like protein